jgi:hypothetical protein
LVPRCSVVKLPLARDSIASSTLIVPATLLNIGARVDVQRDMLRATSRHPYVYKAQGARVTLTHILGDCHASFTQPLLESVGRTSAEGTSVRGCVNVNL